MNPKHLTAKAVAEELSVSVDQVKKMITGGDLPAIDVGQGKRTFWRIAREDLDKWTDDQRAATARRFGASA